MKKIEKFMLPEHTNSLYENEAISSISLTKEVADKINEIVDMINQLSQADLEWKQTQEGTIRKGVLFMKDNLVNTLQELFTILQTQGFIDNRLEEYTKNITARVDNLLGKVKEGSTSGDAELIDGRLTYDGRTYANIGTAIREQLSNSVKGVRGILADANTIRENGVYWCNATANTPGASGILLMAGSEKSNLYRWMQVFFEYRTSNIYLRYVQTATENTVWENWRKLGETNYNVASGEHDLNNYTNAGAYYFSGQTTVANTPEGQTAPGVLFVVRPTQNFDYAIIQFFQPYANNQLWWRGANNKGFLPWERSVTTSELSAITSGKVYTIEKVDSNNLNIYKNGVNGLIRYTYKRDINPNDNLDVCRLYTTTVCDTSKTPIHPLQTSGADLDGVVLLKNDSADHIGGVHGDEVMSNYYLFVDGKQYTFDSVPNGNADEIKFIVNSTIYHVEDTTPCLTKNKQTTFDKDGVHIRMRWKSLEDNLVIQSIRSCMFSITKDCFTHYWDSNVNTTPTEVSKSATPGIISESAKMNDIYYSGVVSAHHWAGERGGNSENYSTIIQDYGERLKSYFNCYDGFTANTGDEMYAENHFNITV